MMEYLLDTHILLWWLANPEKLRQSELEIIKNPDNRIYLSSVCTWEIAIKKALGKLEIPPNFYELVSQEPFVELPVSVAHTKSLLSLPMHHSDPFDRLLVAQALTEELTVITHDNNLLLYPVSTLQTQPSVQ